MEAQTIAGPRHRMDGDGPRVDFELLDGLLDNKDNHNTPLSQQQRQEVFARHDELPAGYLSGPPKIRISRGCDGEFVCQLVTRIRAYELVRFARCEQAIKQALPVARRLQAKIVGKGVKRRLAKAGAQ